MPCVSNLTVDKLVDNLTKPLRHVGLMPVDNYTLSVVRYLTWVFLSGLLVFSIGCRGVIGNAYLILSVRPHNDHT